MYKKVTKQLYESLKAKLEAATTAAMGKGKGKGKGDKGAAAAKAKRTGKKAAAAAAKRKAAAASTAKGPSTAEANLQRNVSLLKKLGAHRTQADVLKKARIRKID